MLKKISYFILIAIIIAGGIVVGVNGFNKSVQYKRNVTIYVKIGQEFENKDMMNIAKEVFPDESVIVQKVELYNDMVSFTLEEKSDEELQPKLEELNNKINEKYELENTVDDISVTHNPKVRLYDIAKTYVIPIGICTLLVFIYAMIRFRKLGVFRTLGKYIVGVIGTEAVYVGLLAITRYPIDAYVVPVGLFIYAISILVVTVKRENKLKKLQMDEK